MGRSTTSCFNIISCRGSNESVDTDEIDASSENNGPDKRGWSFRKRSARHRVLSNTAVTEVPFLENKETSEHITISSEPQFNSNISEKTPDNIWTEEMPNSITKTATVLTMDTEAACEEDDIKREPVTDESESAILVIQAAVRRFLAQRQLAKLKNIVKLQAAVRGHLVRTHAVGTLRCVQAIVKMQALVRARHAKTSSIGEKGVQNPRFVSIEKLLSNKLARQLLESTPKYKQINIKCDPSKSDSAWNWLERWMSVSSPETLDKINNNTDNKVETVIQIPFQKPIDSNPENPVLETEPKHSAKRIATDQPDLEGRKSVFGSRKASNPAFIAAQSKFEELTSKNNPLKSVNSDPLKPVDIDSSVPFEPVNVIDSSEDIGSDSEKPTAVTAVEPDEYVISDGSRAVQNGGSECGTELSVTSTLDSPDQSEPENKKSEPDPEPESEPEPEPEPEPELKPEPKLEHVPQLSAQESPRSHITVPESQGTPSSQVSTNTKKTTKIDKNVTSQKRKSWSTTKKLTVDSGLRTSLDQLTKEPKQGKRRNSFGSPKPDQIDNEPCVPSYMQATESAKLKAVANGSPRSSPDVQDKEIYLKKRHSLPGAVNGRHGSPRIQRSVSQAVQTTKGNGNIAPHPCYRQEMAEVKM